MLGDECENAARDVDEDIVERSICSGMGVSMRSRRCRWIMVLSTRSATFVTLSRPYRGFDDMGQGAL